MIRIGRCGWRVILMPVFRAIVVLGESLTPVGQLRFYADEVAAVLDLCLESSLDRKSARLRGAANLSPFEAGPFHTSGQPGNMRDALAGVFAAAAPDSWGPSQSSSTIRSRWHFSINAPNMENGFYQVFRYDLL